VKEAKLVVPIAHLQFELTVNCESVTVCKIFCSFIEVTLSTHGFAGK
jgi:hypothetical protein